MSFSDAVLSRLRLDWSAVGLIATLAFALMPTTPAQGAAQAGSSAASTPKAQSGGSAYAWNKLSREQQLALAPLQREWPNIETSRRAKWLEVAGRFQSMPDDERQRIRDRMSEWARLSPAERGQARMQFQVSRQLTAEDRQTKWDEYQALPEKQRLELASRAKPAPPKASAAVPRPATTATMSVKSKQNIVAASAAQTHVKAVTPTVVQAKPGATTTLMSQPASPPLHQQPGLPKIAATDGFVNPATLLPLRGPQAMAARTTSPQPPARP